MSESARPATSATGHGRHGEPAGTAPDPDEVWRRVAAAGVRLMRIPTPFLVGRVNTYLIEDEPLTLIDSGPNSGKALDELERQLDALGHSLSEIGLILLTHQHIDHTGLVEIVARRSGAEVAAIDLLAPFLANYSEEAERDDEYSAELMQLHGIPEEVVIALRSVSRSFRAWGSGATVTRRLGDGEIVATGDRGLEVQLRPGHSPTDTLYWDADRRIVFGGDHLIGHISSNPLIARPLDRSRQRPKALLTYLGSLRRTRELPAEIILPGHGEPVTDHVALIDSRIAMHERRAEKMLELLRPAPLSAHQIAQRLWGNVAVTQAYLTLSEVLGHMDLLAARGAVRELTDDGVIRFAAVEGSG